MEPGRGDREDECPLAVSTSSVSPQWSPVAEDGQPRPRLSFVTPVQAPQWSPVVETEVTRGHYHRHAHLCAATMEACRRDRDDPRPGPAGSTPGGSHNRARSRRPG